MSIQKIKLEDILEDKYDFLTRVRDNVEEWLAEALCDEKDNDNEFLAVILYNIDLLKDYVFTGHPEHWRFGPANSDDVVTIDDWSEKNNPKHGLYDLNELRVLIQPEYNNIYIRKAKYFADLYIADYKPHDVRVVFNHNGEEIYETRANHIEYYGDCIMNQYYIDDRKLIYSIVLGRYLFVEDEYDFTVVKPTATANSGRQFIVKDKKTKKLGVVNISGDTIIPCAYEKIENVGGYYYALKRKCDKGFRLYHTEREFISEQVYDEIKELKRGLYSVRQEDKWGVIEDDGFGKVVIPVIAKSEPNRGYSVVIYINDNNHEVSCVYEYGKGIMFDAKEYTLLSSNEEFVEFYDRERDTNYIIEWDEVNKWKSIGTTTLPAPISNQTIFINDGA